MKKQAVAIGMLLLVASGIASWAPAAIAKECPELSTHQLDNWLSDAMNQRIARKTKQLPDGATGDYSLQMGAGTWQYSAGAGAWSHPVVESDVNGETNLIAIVSCKGAVEYSVGP